MQIKHTFLFILLIGCVGNRRGKRVVALQVRFNNERGDVLVTTPPPAIEISQPSDAELLFPHLVNGGGYTTQFILFSGTAGQSTTGNLQFIKQDGTEFNLNVN